MHYFRAKLFAPGSIANKMVRSVPGDVYLPKKFASMAERIYNMEVRPDDIWILTYPKSGTTWTQVNKLDICCESLLKNNNHVRSWYGKW